MSLSPMLHVEFNKCPCRSVDFRGQGPLGRASVDTARIVGKRGPWTNKVDRATRIIPKINHPTEGLLKQEVI